MSEQVRTVDGRLPRRWRISGPCTYSDESPALGLTRNVRNRELEQPASAMRQLLLVVLNRGNGLFDGCVNELVVDRLAREPAAVEERSEQGCDGC